jgi:hypothetical protein
MSAVCDITADVIVRRAVLHDTMQWHIARVRFTAGLTNRARLLCVVMRVSTTACQRAVKIAGNKLPTLLSCTAVLP